MLFTPNHLSFVRVAPLVLCFALPIACDDAAVELEDVADTTGASDGDDELRFATPMFDYPTLVTSMNTDWKGDNGGCWDTSPNGNVRPFQQYPCHGKDNQLWKFESMGDGSFRIHSDDDEGLCIDVPSNDFVSGKDLQLFPCHGGANQRWTVNVHSNAASTIRPRDAQGLCMDVENAITTNYSKIQIYTCHFGSNQQWRMHDWMGKDTSLDCDWAMRFGSHVVSNGTRQNFFASGQEFNTLCSENLQSDSVNCPSGTDWFVVDSPWGSDDFDVRCFQTF
ncbi:MAG: RICIN domain-containing protein [Deltaproteobacteria bacterium]|nr:RICIN domain-containing protein [Deltaproteobacteria bacterium]